MEVRVAAVPALPPRLHDALAGGKAVAALAGLNLAADALGGRFSFGIH